MKELRMTLNLSYSTFLFYWYLPEIQIAYMQTSKKERSKTCSYPKWLNIFDQVVEEMILNEIPITIDKVSRALGVCPENLRLHNRLKDIKQAKERQKQKIKKEQSNNLKQKATRLIQEANENGQIIKSPYLYELLGTKRTVLVRTYPELTKYISKLLKFQKISMHI